MVGPSWGPSPKKYRLVVAHAQSIPGTGNKTLGTVLAQGVKEFTGLGLPPSSNEIKVSSVPPEEPMKHFGSPSCSAAAAISLSLSLALALSFSVSVSVCPSLSLSVSLRSSLPGSGIGLVSMKTSLFKIEAPDSERCAVEVYSHPLQSTRLSD